MKRSSGILFRISYPDACGEAFCIPTRSYYRRAKDRRGISRGISCEIRTEHLTLPIVDQLSLGRNRL